MWMSGFGSRDKPSEGKLHDLWAKAVALEDPVGERFVLVTLDLVGIDRATSERICTQLASRHGLERRQIAINTSHTHCGPVVGRNLVGMFGFDERGWQAVDAYTDRLVEQIVNAAGEAIGKLLPSRLDWGQGFVAFGVNRRTNNRTNYPKLRETGQLIGPCDYDVPVLTVREPSGLLKAVVFGYACHATAAGAIYEWCGDYPGFAQAALEERHPGAVAMYWAGCGGDQSFGARDVELARECGTRLASAIDEVLSSVMKPIGGTMSIKYTEIPLALDALPDRAKLDADTGSKNVYIARAAKKFLAQIDAGTPLSATYPYPVQTVRLGNGPIWLFLGGEVVVDYSLRLKRELGQSTTWVAGYSNDVMAYIPSHRVWNEGGYEGATAMVYYGLPTRWSERVEDQIIDEVRRQNAR